MINEKTIYSFGFDDKNLCKLFDNIETQRKPKKTSINLNVHVFIRFKLNKQLVK